MKDVAEQPGAFTPDPQPGEVGRPQREGQTPDPAPASEPGEDKPVDPQTEPVAEPA